MRQKILPIVLLGALVFASACGRGQAEKTGESIDSRIEETTQGQKDLRDGPLENAGEAADRAADQVIPPKPDDAPPETERKPH